MLRGNTQLLCLVLGCVWLGAACDGQKPAPDLGAADTASQAQDATDTGSSNMVDTGPLTDANTLIDTTQASDTGEVDVPEPDSMSAMDADEDTTLVPEVTASDTMQDVGVMDPCEMAFCDEFATCTVSDGQAVCACKKGYVGDGNYCEAEGDPCANYEEPGCLNKGCPQGQVCDMMAACVPGMCVCDKKSGLPHCTPNCMGGVCVQDPSCKELECDLECKGGYAENESGCPVCECAVKKDLCADFNPTANCGPDGKDKDAPGCQWDCVCKQKDGAIVCPKDPCGPGSCNMGAYCQGAGCADPKCYAPNHPRSLLLCQGVIDSCCGEGECVQGGYCTGSACDNPLCYLPGSPISEVMCGDLEPPAPDCGIGSCDKDGRYCDNCTCYKPEHVLSQALCGCTGDNPGPNTFQKVYGHYDGDDIGMAAIELSDGGFLFGGWHGMVVRTDKYGDPIWMNVYEHEFIQDLVATDDTFYLLGDGGLIATAHNGDIKWAVKSMGYATSLALAPDGGIVFGGRFGEDAYLVKATSSGTFEWGRTYGGSAFDWFTHVEPLADGYLMLGTTESFGAAGSDYLLVRTTLTGDLQWAKRLGTDENDGDSTFYYRVAQTTDGGFIVAGTTFSGMVHSGLAIKLKANADVEWATRVGGQHGHDYSAVTEVKDGYVFFGTSKDVPVVDFPFNQGKANVWISKLDVNGGLMWNRAYGEVGMDGNYTDGGKTSDGGLFLISHSHNYFVNSPDEKRHYLLKTDGEGLTEGCCNTVPTQFVTASATISVTDVTSEVSGKALLLTPPPLTVVATPYTIATRGTVCERSRGRLCGGLSTGYLDFNVPYSLAPTPVGCNCTP